MDETIRYEVKPPGSNTVITGEKEALAGLKLIGGQLAQTGWKDLNTADPADLDYTRAQSLDIKHTLGDNPQILRFNGYDTAMWNHLESAIQHAGALVRTGKPVYNASLGVSRGKVVLFANSEGVGQIEASVARHAPEAEQLVGAGAPTRSY